MHGLAYLYRFINPDGEPSDWVGVAIGDNKKDLFTIIDEAGDPFSVEIMTLRYGGVAWKLKEEGSYEGKIEPSEHFRVAIEDENGDPYGSNGKWRKPDWGNAFSKMRPEVAAALGWNIPD